MGTGIELAISNIYTISGIHIVSATREQRRQHGCFEFSITYPQ
jgi:hypothetical protein